MIGRLSEVMNASSETLAHLITVRDMYFSWLLWSSGAVAVGVALEGPELIHEARKTLFHIRVPSPRWITLVALIGWILVAIGVLGEGISEALVSRADGKIQASNDERLANTTKEAGDAKTSARAAAGAAATADQKTQSAKDDAEAAASIAARVRKEVRSLELAMGKTRSDLRAAQEEARELRSAASFRYVLRPQFEQTLRGSNGTAAIWYISNDPEAA